MIGHNIHLKEMIKCKKKPKYKQKINFKQKKIRTQKVDNFKLIKKMIKLEIKLIVFIHVKVELVLQMISKT